MNVLPVTVKSLTLLFSLVAIHAVSLAYPPPPPRESVGQVICPSPGCKKPMSPCGPNLPSNWLASHFFDPKHTQKKLCQVCTHHGTQTQATHWCESCSKSSEIQFYCDTCQASEHSTLNTRSHKRVPVEKMSYSFGLCSKHQLSEDHYCFDCKAFMCSHCLLDYHKSHSTKLVIAFGREVKAELRAAVETVSGPLKSLEKSERNLQKTKQQKQQELDALKKKMIIIESEVELIDTKIIQVQENAAKSRAAALVLMNSIEVYPIRDTIDSKKVEILKKRIHLTGQILPKMTLKERGYKFKFKIGSHGTGPGQLSSPQGVGLDRSGNFYVTDKTRVQVFDSQGTFSRCLATQFELARGIVINPEGFIVVIDTALQVVQMFDPDGGLKGRLGARMGSPNFATLDQDGNILITDHSKSCIHVFDPEGKILRTILLDNCKPFGVAIDPEGNLVISDTHSCKIQIRSPTGQFIRDMGGKGSGDGLFIFPYGVATDSFGNIFAADFQAHKIQIFSNSGEFLMKIGSKGEGEGQLNHPSDILVHPNGDLVVVDSSNSRIQVFG